jgi:hypothetical protein
MSSDNNPVMALGKVKKDELNCEVGTKASQLALKRVPVQLTRRYNSQIPQCHHPPHYKLPCML